MDSARESVTMYDHGGLGMHHVVVCPSPRPLCRDFPDRAAFSHYKHELIILRKAKVLTGFSPYLTMVHIHDVEVGNMELSVHYLEARHGK